MKNFWNFRPVNFKFRFFNFIAQFLLFAVLLTSVGCDDDMSSIGLNLKNRDDLLNATFTDTTTLYAYSVLEDSLKTTELANNILGSIVDEIFGMTTAGMATQFIPDGFTTTFGDAPELDSIVLMLRYRGGFFGDTLNPFYVKVYELNETISSTDTFFSNSSIPHTEMNIAYNQNFLLYPKPTSNVMLDTVYGAHIRIRLDDELGQRFLDNVNSMNSNESFKNFFKGLYICAEPAEGSGSLVNINFTHASLSRIQLYYKDSLLTKKYSFLVSSESAKSVRINTFKHNHEMGERKFIQQVLEKDTMLGEEMLYLQSMAGIKTKIGFPHLKTLKDKKMVINKAELVITKVDESKEFYIYPSILTLQGVNKKGTLVRLPDDTGTGGYFGGIYNTGTKEYRFRITRYVQDVILRDNFEPYIYLVVNAAAANASRTLLHGYNTFDPTTRLRLEIYYTEY